MHISEKDVFEAYVWSVFIKVPGVISSALAEFIFTALFTFPAGETFSEYFKFVFPDVFETIFENVAHYEFRTAFDIKTGGNIAV